MSWDSVRPQIVELLKQVQGIGQVHEYVRHTVFWKDFFERNVKDQKVSSWEVTRVGMEDQFDDVGNHQVVGLVYRNTHRALLVGRMAVDDSRQSELEFQGIVDRIVKLLEVDVQLGGRLLIATPPTVESIGHNTFGGVLVHEARILFNASVRSRSTG